MRGEPQVTTVHANDTDLAVHDWGGEGPHVLLVHATGLCARVWDAVVATLPDDLHVMAIDLRGHGRSPAPDPVPPRFRWRLFGEDIAAALDVLGLEDVLVVGHSMGGHSAVVAALHAPGRISRLLLLDPTLSARPPEGSPPPAEAAEQPAARRRDAWASPQEFTDRLRGQRPFSTWDEVALHAYTSAGLTPDPTIEGHRLACPPLFEASVYAGRDTASLDDDLPNVIARVNVVRARDRVPADPPGLGPSATRLEAVRMFPQVRDRQIADGSHFFPLEMTGVMRGLIEDALAW